MAKASQLSSGEQIRHHQHSLAAGCLVSGGDGVRQHRGRQPPQMGRRWVSMVILPPSLYPPAGLCPFVPRLSSSRQVAFSPFSKPFFIKPHCQYMWYQNAHAFALHLMNSFICLQVCFSFEGRDHRYYSFFICSIKHRYPSRQI